MKTMTSLIGIFLFSLASQSALATIQVGQAAPETQLVNLMPNGAEAQQSVNSALKEGQKVVLEFFSTTCVYCLENLPKVKEMQQLIGDKATFRHVGIDRSEADLRQFASENKDIMVALDFKREAKKAYSVYATPTTVIIGAGNKVIFTHEGVWSESDKTEIKNILMTE